MELGYLGPEGSYSYRAANHYGEDVQLVAKRTFSEITEAVEEGVLEKGILPIENSTEGAVTQVMDGLMKTKISKIQGELTLRVRHNLLSLGKEVENVKYVLSHPQALEQCREYFAKKHPRINFIPCESSSIACKIAKDKGKEYGAIGDRWAAKKNGLNILCSDIQDNFYNQTRFIIIGRDVIEPVGNDKTSIAFSFHDDYPGSLYEVLKEFAKEKINLTRIESRPAKTEMGKYIFYIDFNGHQMDEKVRRVMDNIERQTNKLKIFGSFPVGKIV